MDTVIPRWEWRTFGADFGAADDRFKALKIEKVQESDEVYLLSPVTDANVKIRDGFMDIKRLEQTSPTGLEQWRPVMKAAFPLSPDEVNRVCTMLGVTPPSPGRDAFTLDQLRADLTASARRVRTAEVHKRRLRYTIGECMAEVADLIADGKRTRTVAIESENADHVIATVREIGLSAFRNISYPRGLKALLGLNG
jgi:exopolyphosphatase/guanosine-5'-triphosphate,3'-diphosphate pyrophosphatase